MEYTKLGNTDIEVSKLCVGCMSFAYLEECYVPHPIVGAIDKNPAQGVMLLDEKK